MGKLTKLSSVTVLAFLVVFTFSSCNKAIKVKKLTGSWKVSAASITSTSEETTTTSYSGTACGGQNTSTDTNTDENTLTFNGTNVSWEYNQTHNGTLNGSTGDYDLTMTVDINDDGTYTAHVTYALRDDNGVVVRTGDVTTDLNEWYLDDSDEKNSAVVFYNFPDVFNLGGNLDYNDVTLNIEEGSGSEIIFSSSAKNDATVTDTNDFFGCLTTSTNVTHDNSNMSYTFTSND
jgi:hypothetical protein